MSDRREGVGPRRSEGVAARNAARAFFAASDQAFYGAAHFAVQVLAGRWMTVEEYGLFAILYAGVSLAHMLHAAFIVEPMLVLCAGDAGTGAARILRRVMPFSTGLASWVGATGAAIALGAIALGSPVGVTLGIASVSIVPLSTAWVVRRVHYLGDASHWSAWLTLLYSLLTLVGLSVLQWTGAVTASAALAAMGVAGGLMSGIALGWIFKGRGIAVVLKPQSFRVDEFGREMFSYGKWAAGATALNWLLNNAFYLALPVFATVTAAGSFRALMNVLLPIQTVLMGLATLFLPRVTRQFRSGRGTVRTWVVTTVVFTALAGVYSLGVYLLFPRVVRLLYDGKYDSVTTEMGVGFLVPVFWAVIFAAVTMIRAASRPRSILVAYLWIVLTIAVWLVPLGATQGLGGAMLAYTVLQATMMVVLVGQWLRISRMQGEAREVRE